MELSNNNSTDNFFLNLFSNHIHSCRRIEKGREIFIFRLRGVVFPHTSKIPTKSAKVCEFKNKSVAPSYNLKLI